MSKAKVVGVRPYDFKNSNGEQVSGLSVFVIEPSNGCYGMEPNKISLMGEKAAQLYKTVGGDYNKLVNATVEIVYNKRGRAEDFHIAQ